MAGDGAPPSRCAPRCGCCLELAVGRARRRRRCSLTPTTVRSRRPPVTGCWPTSATSSSLATVGPLDGDRVPVDLLAGCARAGHPHDRLEERLSTWGRD